MFLTLGHKMVSLGLMNFNFRGHISQMIKDCFQSNLVCHLVPYCKTSVVSIPVDTNSHPCGYAEKVLIYHFHLLPSGIYSTRSS